MTLLIVTHDIGFAYARADRVLEVVLDQAAVRSRTKIQCAGSAQMFNGLAGPARASAQAILIVFHH